MIKSKVRISCGHVVLVPRRLIPGEPATVNVNTSQCLRCRHQCVTDGGHKPRSRNGSPSSPHATVACQGVVFETSETYDRIVRLVGIKLDQRGIKYDDLRLVDQHVWMASLSGEDVAMILLKGAPAELLKGQKIPVLFLGI